MKTGDKIIVRMYSCAGYSEIMTRNHGKVFAVRKENGKLGIDWNQERSPYINSGNTFVPFDHFCGTSVTFENASTGKTYHWSNVYKKMVDGPCQFEESNLRRPTP